MKRIMIAALAILMLVSLSIGGVLPVFAESLSATTTADSVEAPKVGATSTQPVGADLSGYKVTPVPANARPINNVADFLSMEANGTYYLTTDLTLYWTYTPEFTGKLYGNGKTVTTTVPLFDKLRGAAIYDLVIEGSISKADYAGALAEEGYVPRITGVINNADVTSTTNGYTGGLIGAIWTGDGETSFRYCVNNGYVNNAGAASGQADAGGLVGIVRGSTTGQTKDGVYTQLVDAHDQLIVENCVNNGDVYGSNRIGGIIGVMGENAQLFGTIRVTNCTNNGDITSTRHYVGGITARVSGIDVAFENCLNAGNVETLTAEKYGGGIVGLSEDPGIKLVFRNCRNEGDVTTTSFAGGILGKGSKWGTYFGTGTTVEKDGANIPASSFYFYDCVNAGDITSAYNAGGFGLIEDSVETVFERCENHGTLTARDNAGGMAIQLKALTAVIQDCYNNGAVNASDAGGMIGEYTGNNSKLTIRNCVNDAPITGGRPGGIIGAVDGKTVKGQVIDCVNNAKILSTSNYGGGIAGRFDARVDEGAVDGFESTYAVLFLRCVNNGEVEVFQSQGGGIVGYVDGSHKANSSDTADTVYSMEFRDCTNNAYIHPTDLNKGVTIGGIGGNVDAKVKASGLLNTGKIRTGKARSGGVFGIIWKGPSVIEDSANTGDVTNGGGKDTDVGGIIGLMNSKSNTISRCVNTGNITGDYRVGGIAGYVGCSGATSSINYCVNTGNVYSSAAYIDERSQTTGGIVGYIYEAVGSLSYNASLGNVTAKFDNDPVLDNDKEMVAGAIAGYQNHGTGNYKYNYFAGKIDAGLGLAVMLKNIPGDNVDSGVGSKFVGNFSVITYPLFYRQATGVGANNPDPDTWGLSDATSSPISADTSSATFLKTLNDAAGVGTFVMVTTCEGESFPIHKDTVAAFELARTHSDAEHDYYTNMKKDATHHWYECAVCGEMAPEGKEAHKGGVANCVDEAKCSVCESAYGEIDANNHLHDVAWVADVNGHSATTTCCEQTIELAPHTFEDGVCTVCAYVCQHPAHEDSTAATCGAPAYCGVCESSYGELDPNTHVFESAWSFDATTEAHYRACTNENCTVRADEAACSGGDAKCNALAECATCGHEYGELEAEDHASDETTYLPNQNDVTKHDLVHVCCEAVIETLDHATEDHVAATCCTPAICKDCGPYGAFDPSNHHDAFTEALRDNTDPTKHILVYGDCCGAEVVGEHIGGEASCDAAAICDVCGLTYGVADGDHVFHGACDDKCNVCGIGRDAGDHVYGEWQVTKEPTEAEFGEQERTCTVCGKTQKSSVSIITNPDSALNGIADQGGQSDYSWLGAIVIFGAAAVVIGIVVVFIVSKKKKAK